MHRTYAIAWQQQSVEQKLAEKLSEKLTSQKCVYIYISLLSSTALSLHSFHYLHIAIAIHCVHSLACFGFKIILLFISFSLFFILTLPPHITLNLTLLYVSWKSQSLIIIIIFLVSSSSFAPVCFHLIANSQRKTLTLAINGKHCFNSQVNTEQVGSVCALLCAYRCTVYGGITHSHFMHCVHCAITFNLKCEI